ncbi:MAG: hypothetical protein ACR2NS_10085 [Gemmatimonadaceae bacterium]
MPRRNLRPGLHLLAFPLVLILAACRGDERPLSSGDSQAATGSAQVSVEKPVWRFGEETTRTDVLPAELDTMAAWGEYPDSTQPVAYGIDLNGDGSKEWFVRANSGLCGFSGCPTALMTRGADGKFIDVLHGLAPEVAVTNRRAADWPVLWILTGGRDGGVFRMELKNGAYSLSRRLSHASAPSEETSPVDTFAARLNAATSR